MRNLRRNILRNSGEKSAAHYTLHLERDYVRNGVRAIAENLCTRQLGYRTQTDAVGAERREIDERRFTSLDRIIARRGDDLFEDGAAATHFVIKLEPVLRSVREQNIAARIVVLHAMKLAAPHGPTEWHVRRDFETVLRAAMHDGPAKDARGTWCSAFR